MFVLTFLAFFLLVITKTNQSHFRGGSITWRPSNSNQNNATIKTEVLITTRFFWDLKSFSPLCDSYSGILNANLIGESTPLITPMNGDPWYLDPQVNCVDYSLNDSWSYGKRTQSINISSNLEVIGTYASCCWAVGINSVSGTNSWNFLFKINLKQRNDIMKINSSPLTNMISYIKLGIGCKNNQSIPIPVSDPDGDTIKCRCMNDICLNDLLIDKDNCIIYFNPVFTGYYAIELQIEDFENKNSNVSLSSIPLKLTADVLNDSSLCITTTTTKTMSSLTSTVLKTISATENIILITTIATQVNNSPSVIETLWLKILVAVLGLSILCCCTFFIILLAYFCHRQIKEKNNTRIGI